MAMDIKNIIAGIYIYWMSFYQTWNVSFSAGATGSHSGP
ncbi:hypothetical protein DSUL_60322 [Desulfovibrionales bacterium]